jgi:hypothetical protein
MDRLALDVGARSLRKLTARHHRRIAVRKAIQN